MAYLKKNMFGVVLPGGQGPQLVNIIHNIDLRDLLFSIIDIKYYSIILPSGSCTITKTDLESKFIVTTIETTKVLLHKETIATQCKTMYERAGQESSVTHTCDAGSMTPTIAACARECFNLNLTVANVLSYLIT